MKKRLFTILSFVFAATCLPLAACHGSDKDDHGIVTSIAVETLPKTEFLVNDVFTVDGGQIKATFQDKTFEIVDMSLSMIKTTPDLTVVGEKEVKLSYEGQQTSYTINVKEAGGGGEKLVPTINFASAYAESGFTLYIEDTWDFGISVNDGVQYEVFYTKDDGATNLGSNQPKTAGTYAVNVKTIENDQYASTTTFRWFYARSKNKSEPSVSWGIESGTLHYKVGDPLSLADFGFSINEGIEYDWYFTINDGAVNLGKNPPSEVPQSGTAAINVVSQENDQYNAYQGFIWFWVEGSSSGNIQITFGYENGALRLKAGQTVTAETFGISVTGIDTYEWYITIDDGATNLGHNMPATVPASGTAAVNVQAGEQHAFMWFYVEEGGNPQPGEITITFGYENGALRLKAGQTVTAETFGISVTGIDTYEWYITIDDGATNLGHEMPATVPASGTAAVNVQAGDKHAFMWFFVDEGEPQPGEITISFGYENGTLRLKAGQTVTEETFGISVTGTETYTWWVSIDEGVVNLGHNMPESVPASGTAAVNVQAGDKHAFMWFFVDPAVESGVEITFGFENGELTLKTGQSVTPETFGINVTGTETYTWWVSIDDGVVDLGHNMPESVPASGTAAVNVRAGEKFAFRWFYVEQGSSPQPTEVNISFGYENGALRLKAGQTVTAETFGISVTGADTYEWYISIDDGATNLGHNMPATVPASGTAAVNVQVGDKHAFMWFYVDPAVESGVEISFGYGNGELTLKAGQAVTPETFGINVTGTETYTWSITIDDGAVDLGHNMPETVPASGTAAVNVRAGDKFAFMWFHVVA